MKLTLTREQIPLARETVAWLMGRGPRPHPTVTEVPGYDLWKVMRSPSEGYGDSASREWADALEAAITEEEGAQAPQPGPVSDADERAFWREAYIAARSHATISMGGNSMASYAANEADEALARYRKAFCAGMPSDQKGAK